MLRIEKKSFDIPVHACYKQSSCYQLYDVWTALHGWLWQFQFEPMIDMAISERSMQAASNKDGCNQQAKLGVVLTADSWVDQWFLRKFQSSSFSLLPCFVLKFSSVISPLKNCLFRFALKSFHFFPAASKTQS